MRTFLLFGSLAVGLTSLVLLSSPALAQTADVALEVEVQPQPIVQPAPVQAQPYGQPQQPPPQYQQPVPVTTIQPQQQAYPPYAIPPSQERRRNSVFIEGLGAGLLWSVNFERLVIEDLGVRIGVGAFTLSAGFFSDRVLVVTVPVSVSYLGLGSSRHMFEVGLGATLVVAADATSGVFSSRGSGAAVFGTVFAGYRLHPTGNAGFLFRAGIMGMFARGFSLASDATADDFGILPWPYVGGGMSF